MSNRVKHLRPGRVKQAEQATANTAGSFDFEIINLLRTRLLVLFGLLLFGAIVNALQWHWGGSYVRSLPDTTLSPYYHLLVYVPFILAFFALGFIYFFGRSSRQLFLLTFNVATIGFVFLVFRDTVLLPGDIGSFRHAVLLIVIAAFVPWPPILQLLLSLFCLFSFVFFRAIIIGSDPELLAFWDGIGGIPAIRLHLVHGSINLGVITLVGYIMTRNLHHLRRSVHSLEKLGSYDLKHQIGEGGMGVVYAAEHSLIRRPSALKVLNAASTKDEDGLLRFEREARLCAMLTHPNTITIYDYGRTQDNTFYYAMEFLEGFDLQKLVGKFGPLPAERVVYILRQACNSLAEAHGKGIIHRDIKPANIFLTARGGLFDFVKVLDFGLARNIEKFAGDGVTQAGAIVGTPLYIAPESLRDNEGVDHRSDLYSLGATAYFMLTGKVVYPKSSGTALLADILQKAVPNPSEVSPIEIPRELDIIVKRLLAKKPAGRFDSADALSAELAKVRLQNPWSPARAKEWWAKHFDVSNRFHVSPKDGVINAPVN